MLQIFLLILLFYHLFSAFLNRPVNCNDTFFKALINIFNYTFYYDDGNQKTYKIFDACV